MKSVNLDGIEIFPTKIICIGRNFVDHIEELNNEIPRQPVIFIKPNSAISDTIHFNESEEIHYEGEITFLVQSGQLCAVGFGLDLTKRQIQSTLKAKGLPWERAKAFDKSAVFSEFVRFNGNISDLHMVLLINDVTVQQSGYDYMLTKPQQLLDEVKSSFSLEDGDLLMTGTPKGVGKIKIGDRFTGKVFSDNQMIIEQSWTVT